MARTIGLSIYEDLKLRKEEGENSSVVWKGAFKQLTGHVLATGSSVSLRVRNTYLASKSNTRQVPTERLTPTGEIKGHLKPLLRLLQALGLLSLDCKGCFRDGHQLEIEGVKAQGL
jgi:hypothetical protein